MFDFYQNFMPYVANLGHIMSGDFMSYVAKFGGIMAGDFMSGDILTWIHFNYNRQLIDIICAYQVNAILNLLATALYFEVFQHYGSVCIRPIPACTGSGTA